MNEALTLRRLLRALSTEDIGLDCVFYLKYGNYDEQAISMSDVSVVMWDETRGKVVLKVGE